MIALVVLSGLAETEDGVRGGVRGVRGVEWGAVGDFGRGLVAATAPDMVVRRREGRRGVFPVIPVIPSFL